MFNNYVGAKTQKRRKWVSMFVALSVILHVVAIGGLLVRSFWVIGKLTPPELAVTTSTAPPPPPPPPKGSKTPTETKTKTKKIKKVKDTVQPDPDREKPEEKSTSESDFAGVAGGIEGGVEGGVQGGVLGGVEGGVVGGTGSAPPPPPDEPELVPPQALEEQRISGTKKVIPSKTVRTNIKRAGTSQVVTVVKLCVNKSGNVYNVNMVKRSKFPSYNRKILGAVRGWRYRPFKVNGRIIEKCSTVTFIYRQSDN